MAVQGTPESRAEALGLAITQVIAGLQEEKEKPFEIEAFYEYIETDNSEAGVDIDIHPRIRLIKK